MHRQSIEPIMIFTMATNPLISIVIVNFQSVWSLSLALESLFSREHEMNSFEVLVFNNDSNEKRALEQLSRSLPFRLIQSERNIGFGQGVNQAVAQARGSLLGFLNPDTRWLGRSLLEIHQFVINQSRETVLGLRLVDESGVPERFSNGLAPTFPLLFRNKLTSVFDDTRNSRLEKNIDWVSGGGMFLSKKLFLSLGGFDADYFLYFEDVDLCLRAKKEGAFILCDPRFSLEHSGGKSFSSREAQKSLYYKAQDIYFQKHRSKGELFLLRLFHQVLKRV